jgi:hypothetical protein
MAFTIANLQPIGGQAKRGGTAPQLWSYSTLDAHATVDTSGYFNLSTAYDGAYHLLNVGDVIWVTVWVTAIGTGTISTYGTHIVMTKSAGTIDVSNVTVGTVTNSD